MPEVSVIIPNYNHADYLIQRIESILQQTYQDFELIILDDLSTDSSLDVIELYRQHPRVSHIVFNEINSGSTFNQWEKGIELASGKYIWIAESDDWCEPDLLQTLTDGLKNNPECVLGYAQTYVINGFNDIQKVSVHHKLTDCINGKNYIRNYLAESCTIWNASMMLFKKDSYLKVSKAFKSFKMCGDWLFYIEMAVQGDVFVSGRVLNYFRNHAKDVSGKMYSTGNNYIEELAILNALKQKQLISTERFKELLLNKYIQFRVFKNRFSQSIIEQTEKAFFYNDGSSYESFLTRKATINLFKIKARRRLNLLLK